MLDHFLPIPKDVPMHDIWFGLVNDIYGKTVYIDQPTDRLSPPWKQLKSFRWRVFCAEDSLALAAGQKFAYARLSLFFEKAL